MTTILIVVIFLVVGTAVAAALFQMNSKPADKCDKHSGGCGCGTDAGSAAPGSTHSGDSGGSGGGGSGGSGGGDGGGD